MTTKEYIIENLDRTIRHNATDEGNRIGLPYPFTVPSFNDRHQELYYWDTYFSNLGLIECGKIEQAENNLKNLIFLLNNHGIIPNIAKRNILTRSQPPFFGLMLRDMLAVREDRALKEEGYKALCIEWKFWNGKRKSSNGLNIYSSDIPVNDLELERETFENYQRRTGIKPKPGFYSVLNILAEAESGWDFNPRFDGKCYEYNPVDLNSLLWFDEWYLGKLEKELDISNGKEWKEKADKRKALMIELMQDTDGIFYDYSYVENRKTPLKSCASFFPAYVGMTKIDREEKNLLLSVLELAYGVQSTATDYERGNYQWGRTNAWPCLQVVVVEALIKSGYLDDAKRIAQKYITAMDDVFAKTGGIWEKYDAITGEIGLSVEYTTPQMLGWSAGAYLTLLKYIG